MINIFLLKYLKNDYGDINLLNKKFMFMTIFILTLLTISAVSAADFNSTDEVMGETVIDENLEVIQEDTLSTTHNVSGNTFADIQNTIDNAEAGDTVVLLGNYTGKGSGISIGKSLTIEGNGAVLDARQLSGIIGIDTKGSVYIKNVVFINGVGCDGSAVSGGISINCTFINNGNSSEKVCGGAICNGDAINCTFINNFAHAGGAMAFGTAKNCTFIENSVDGTGYISGGATYHVEAFDCIFRQNYAPDKGGAMYGGSASNCLFLYNSYLQTCEAELNNCTMLTKGNLVVSQSSKNYYNEKMLTAKFLSSEGKAIENAEILITFSNGKSAKLKTNSGGVATYSVPFGVGTYSATISVTTENFEVDSVKMDSIKIVKAPVSITPTKLSTTYASGKYFQIKVVNTKTNNALPGVKLTLKVYTGKKYRKVTVTTASNGIAKYSTSKLALGTHKIVVSPNSKDVSGSSKESSVKVSKAAITLLAPKVVNVYKSGTFKVSVKNKESGKGMGGIKVTFKVYTGKKYKIFTAKTNTKGTASISTKSLSIASHKVLVNVKGTSKYNEGSAKSSVKIIKSKSSTFIKNDLFTYRYAADTIVGGDGVFYLYAGDKELKNQKIGIYSPDGDLLYEITSGVMSYVPVLYGTIIFKFAGNDYYKPCFDERVLYR